MSQKPPSVPLAAALIAIASGACGGHGGARAGDATTEATCRATLSPAGAPPPDAAPGTPFAAARSTLLVNAEIPLASVKGALEAKVPKRVAEERDHDIGLAGRLQYTVDRGPFTTSVQGDALVIETPLVARVQACAKGQCYAGCDPQAKMTARVPLRLGADYKFRPSAVRIDVTHGCELRALGGFVRVDVTPIVQSRLAQETKRVEQSIDRELPNLRPEAERIWTELSRPRPLPLGACVVLVPEAIAEGPSSGTVDLARLRFGLLARPEVRVRCGDAPKPVPLPPLRDDGALPPDGDMHLAVVLPAAAPAIAIEGEDFDFGSSHGRVRRATGTTSGLHLELSGEACGPFAVSATSAAWNDDGHTVRLAGVLPLAGESDRASAAGLDAAALTKGLEHASIAVPLAAEQLANVLPELARGLSDDRVNVSAVVTESKPETAGLRGGGEVVAVVHLRGAVTIRAK